MRKWLSTVRRDILARYTPLVGDRAASSQWRATLMQLFFSALILVPVVLSVPLGLLNLKVAAWACFWPFFGTAMVCLVARVWFRYRYFSEASAALGVTVYALRPVQTDPERYKAWCSKQGIVH